MHRRLVYIYLLNVPSFSSRYFNKIKRTSRLGRLLALSLEILFMLIKTNNRALDRSPESWHIRWCIGLWLKIFLFLAKVVMLFS